MFHFISFSYCNKNLNTLGEGENSKQYYLKVLPAALETLKKLFQLAMKAEFSYFSAPRTGKRIPLQFLYKQAEKVDPSYLGPREKQLNYKT